MTTWALVLASGLLCTSASAEGPESPRASTCLPTAAAADSRARALRIVARAREEVATGVTYDRAYVARGSGRPERERGACTDLVVRALAAGGVDLQSAIFNDALRAPAAYANIALVDGRIDHRRAPNQHVWLSRHARKLPVSLRTISNFAPGDIVVWTYGACPECKADHVGVVSDRVGKRGYPLILHNAGPRATEEDALDAWPLVGHFRVVDEDPTSPRESTTSACKAP